MPLAEAELTVETWPCERRAVTKVRGEIDVYSAPQLRHALMDVTVQRTRPLLVIEMSGVGFCDSSGLGVLVSVLRQSRRKGGAVALVGVRAHLVRVLATAGLSQALPVFDSLDEAFVWLETQLDHFG